MSSSEQFWSLLTDRLADQVAEKVAERMVARLQPVNEPVAFSVKMAAKLMNLSVSTLKNMIRDRELEVVRRGTRVLITRNAINKFFESHEA